MSQSPVTWRSSKITFVVTATWASISTLKYKNLCKYSWYRIGYLRLSRSNFFVFSTESRTDCWWWYWISFCWSSSAASGCWWSCWTWWSIHFFKSEKVWLAWKSLDLIWSLEKLKNSVVENLVMVSLSGPILGGIELFD